MRAAKLCIGGKTRRHAPNFTLTSLIVKQVAALTYNSTSPKADLGGFRISSSSATISLAMALA